MKFKSKNRYKMQIVFYEPKNFYIQSHKILRSVKNDFPRGIYFTFEVKLLNSAKVIISN